MSSVAARGCHGARLLAHLLTRPLLSLSSAQPRRATRQLPSAALPDVADGMAATAAAAPAAAAVDATRSQLADFTILKELGRGTCK